MRANAKLTNLPLKLIGRDGEELFTDIAVLGPKRANRVIIHTSGVHGVEGYGGSAIQVALLDKIIKRELVIPSDTAICLIHAVNPYGMSWWRRCNENNVDLNRNCLTYKKLQYVKEHKNTDYDSFSDFLLPDTEPFSWSANFYTVSAKNMVTYGFDSMKQAIAGGQYHVPNGLFYGGDELQQSVKLIYQFLIDNFSSAEYYYHIDLHTGLGQKGYDALLVAPYPNIENWLNVLGDHAEVVKDSSGTSYKVEGTFTEGVRALFSKNEDGENFPCFQESPEQIQSRKSSTRGFYSVTQEFGTLSTISVLKALREENFFYHKVDKNLKNHWSKDAIFASFRIPEKEWEDILIERGLWLFERVLGFREGNAKL